MSENTMNYMMSRLGARLGNWNDRHLWHLDSMREAPRWRRVVDRMAGWFYVRGDSR